MLQAMLNHPHCLKWREGVGQVMYKVMLRCKLGQELHPLLQIVVVALLQTMQHGWGNEVFHANSVCIMFLQCRSSLVLVMAGMVRMARYSRGGARLFQHASKNPQN